MGVSPFLLFIKKYGKDASLKGLKFAQRGVALGKKWKALPAAEKAAFVATAKKTATPKRTKVPVTVLKKAVAKGIPLKFVRKSWYSTKGSSTAGRLNKIAKTAGIQVRKAAKKAAPAKKTAATKKVSKK